uniref:Putative ovule protein n=1 Tax=Solanum chacoense TaxID=4108 RepID=A0A0V0HK32_SOLCH
MTLSSDPFFPSFCHSEKTIKATSLNSSNLFVGVCPQFNWEIQVLYMSLVRFFLGTSHNNKLAKWVCVINSFFYVIVNLSLLPPFI